MRFAIGDKAEAGLGGGLSRGRAPFVGPGGTCDVVPFEGEASGAR